MNVRGESRTSMKEAFHSLDHRGQVRRLAGLARAALGAYALHGARLRLLEHDWNVTFRVTTPDGDQYVLRVHPRGQRSVEAVGSELLWLAALRQEGFSVPEPVLNQEQRLVTVVTHPGVPEPRLCVLFRWVEGRFLDRGLTPSHLAAVGDLMARFHQHAAQWTCPPQFTRHRVDNLDPMQRGPDDEFDPTVAERVTQTVTSVYTPEAGRVVAAVIPRIWATMEALEQEPEAIGLIHGDLHRNNVLFGKGGAGAIDFDDCGYGHWLYDLAVPLTQLHRHPVFPALRQALLAGYRRRRPLPLGQEAHLETFIALRRVQNLLGVDAEGEHPSSRDGWEAAAAGEIERLRAFAEKS
jgi:Ser/Thr protein kinase RdoA (MazF antagonist)